MKKTVLLTIALLLITSLLFADTIRFGVPPWPGVIVKTEVVTQIMKTMGYETEQKEVGAPIIYKTMTIGQMEVFLGAWRPHQNDMLNPLLAKGSLDKVAVNIADSKVGLCVPEYVWKEGIHSIGDLEANGVKFQKKIYNIEPGTGMHTGMSALMEKDVAGLGDWDHMASTAPALLSQVKSKMKRNEWIAFGCWDPHWMNIEFDMRYLDAVPGAEVFINSSSVSTVVSKDFHTKYPELYRFLKQFKVPTEVQSQWIYSYGYKEIEPNQVAREWISVNPELLNIWLKGVKAKNGKPAIKVIEKAYQPKK